MRSRLTSNRSEDRGVQRAGLIFLGVAAVALGLLFAVIGYRAPNAVPGRSYYTPQAEFDRADNLSEHYQVRVGGRLIGQVLNPRVHEGRAVVDLQLKDDVRPLLSDTRLRVRPRSAIGVRFVDVIPGTKGHPLKDGERIPASQTSASLPLDLAFEVLDAQRRSKLQTLVNQLGAGTAGRAQDLNVALGKGDEFVDGLSRGLAPLNARPGATAGFIAGLEGFVGAADPVRAEIANGFSPEADALKPIAEHDDAVRDTLSEAPGTLDSARDQLPPTRALLARTAGFARAATPTLRLAPRALRETSGMLTAAREPLRDADATLRLAERAVDPVLELLHTVKPILPVADDTLIDALPITSELAAHGCDITMFGTNWADATAQGNTGGQFLRLAFVRPGREQLAGLGPANRTGINSNPYPAPCLLTKKPTP
jgi:ABC-type transporter Mla subunit MlaD